MASTPSPSLSPARISAAYFVFGMAWIPATDHLLSLAVPSRGTPTALGLATGWAFVGVSTVLLFVVMHVHDRRVRATGRQLETANQQLQVLHRVFRHNIRNDLNVILGYTRIASDAASEDRTTDQLAHVEATASQLLALSEKLNVIDRIAPAVDGNAVELGTLVAGEVDRFREAHPCVSVTVDRPERLWARGDEALRFAIREVLENAVEHFDGSDADCEVAVRAWQEDDAVHLEVADNGPGVPETELRALRSREETPLVHASSVGLWLVVWLCRLHEGSIDIATSADGGTAVRMRLQPDPRRSLARSASDAGREAFAAG